MTLLLFMSSFLVPLMLSLVWSVFILSENLIISLVSLLLMSLMLPLLFMEHFKLFWPCGLLLILMSTGLIVIFAYIVSLHMKESKPSRRNDTLLVWILGSVLALMILYCKSYPQKVSHPNSGIMVNLILSLVLITLLLYLVINFVRIIYSKGGGFRKKF